MDEIQIRNKTIEVLNKHCTQELTPSRTYIRVIRASETRILMIAEEIIREIKKATG